MMWKPGSTYLQSRYYNPEWGRFLNADGQLNTGFLGYNLFAYAWNNPIMFIDPSGTCSCPMYDPNCRDCRQRKLQAELAGLPFEERVPNYDKISHKYDEDDLTGESNKGLDYGGAELIVTIPISVYAAAIGLFVESTEATVAAVIGTGITIPINLTVHLSNPNLTTNQKCGLAVYDIATGVGGVLITYGMANCWNVTGVPMIIFGILYPVGTYAIGYIIEEKMIQQNTKAQIHW